MSEHSSLFYLILEQMSAKHFDKQSGYELWHQRLGHASFRNIRDTIKCVNGLESLKAYDLRYSCKMSLMYDWEGDIGGLAKGKEGHN